MASSRACFVRAFAYHRCSLILAPRLFDGVKVRRIGWQGRRNVQGAFDRGHISSDGGAVLLRELDAREGFMAWCESHCVCYLVGLARNPRLPKKIRAELMQVREQFEQTQRAARVFIQISYRTLKTWSRSHAASSPRPNTWLKGPTQALCHQPAPKPGPLTHNSATSHGRTQQRSEPAR